MSWIDQLLEATDKAETPRSYIFWSGMSIISAVISPNVWLNRDGVYTLSPNLFVMLIGESGLGKGLPIYIAKKLMDELNCTRVISGSNTIASIILELARTETDEKTGKPKFKDGRAFVNSGEFANLLQEDKRALTILTEWYDSHWMSDWKNSTKTAGIDRIEKLSVTFLAGSTPEHFANTVPKSDINGGFVGRLLTVVEKKRHRINPLSNTRGEQTLPFKELAKHLKDISQLQGGFHYSDDGREFWEEWYTEIRSRDVHDPTGAVNRLPDNVLKVAMCLAMAKGTELILTRDTLEEAVNRCLALTIDSTKLTSGQGKSELAGPTKIVIRTLYDLPTHQIYRSKLLRKLYGEFDVYELDKILQTLINAKLVTTQPHGSDLLIIMPPEAVESLGRLMENG